MLLLWSSVSRHVIFDEHIFPFASSKSMSQGPVIALRFSTYMDFIHVSPLSSSVFPSSTTVTIISCATPSQAQGTQPRDTDIVSVKASSPLSTWEASEEITTQPILSRPVVSSHPMVSRSKLSIVKPNPNYAFVGTTDAVVEPTSLKEALSHSGWLRAMQEELQAIEVNQTLELVSKTLVLFVWCLLLLR